MAPSKKLTYSMLSSDDRERLKRALKNSSRSYQYRVRASELTDRAVQNFDEAYKAIDKLEPHKYLVRAGFGTGAAIFGWIGHGIASFLDGSNTEQEILRKYGCTEIDRSSLPQDFFE